MDPADDGFDGADGGGSGFMVDDRTSLAILLVVNCEGGSGALLEENRFGQGGVQELVSSPEPDVFQPELGGASALVGFGVGVFPHSEEVEEGNDAKVTLGLLEGGGVCLGLAVEVVKDLDWERQLGSWWWILSVIAFKEFLDPDWPRLAWRSAQEGRFASQLDCLGDG